MKRYFSFLLAIAMVFSLAVPARAADSIFVNSETFFVSVSLPETVTGTAMAVIYTYDDTVLEVQTDACAWVPEGVLSDFETDYPQAAWGTEEATELSGEICRLAFRALDLQNFAQTKVSWEITVTNNEETVAVYQDHTILMPEEKPRTLTGIAIASNPTKMVYIQYQDTLDVTGGQLELTYSDGTTEIIDMTADMVSGFDNRDMGSQQLTVTYEGFTAALEITIQEAQGITSGTCGENLTWEFEEETGMLTISGTGEMESFSENAPWSDFADQITEVVLAEGVTSIGDRAFSYCSSLNRITIPEGVTRIGEYAFTVCGSLSTLEIPNSVTYIGKNAFWMCSGLNSVALSENLTCINERTFAYCTGLNGIVIPDSVTSIGNYAFESCTTLNSLVIPSGVTVIGEGAFEECSGLASIALPEDLAGISDRTFWGCVSLTEITFPEGMTSVGSYAFVRCSGLTRLNIPGNVAAVGAEAFAHCSALSEIRFSGCPSFGNDAFRAVTATAYYPANDSGWSADKLQNYGGTITWVPYGGPATSGICGDNVFWSCEGGTLTISGSGAMYSYGSSAAPWAAFKEQITSVEVAAGVTNAGEGAFAGMPVLTQVSLPDTVMEIAYAAFSDCTSLSAVTLPGSVTGISYNAFQNCTGLQTVKLSDNVTSIGYAAFANCTSLTEVEFPGSLNSIGDRAYSNCTGLGQMTFTGSAPAIDANAFAGVYAGASYPAADSTWTADVRQNYGGRLTWIPYGGGHVHAFGGWIADGEKEYRVCGCGYVEERIVTGSGTVEIGSSEDNSLTFTVDPVLPDIAEDEEQYKLVENAVFEDQEILKVFDISLTDSEGEQKQPEGTVKVKLPLENAAKTSSYKVYRVNEDGTLTDMRASRQGNNMVFETDHFSLYVIVEDNMNYDIDGSGTVDETDAMYLIWHTLFPTQYPLGEIKADFTRDGEVTDADALELLWHALFK